MFRVLFIIVAWTMTASLYGCSGISGFSTSKPNSDGAEETAAKSENDKPTESSEGVPGYLVDPSTISVLEEGGQLKIVLDDGSVALNAANSEELEIRVYISSPDQLDGATESEDYAIVAGKVVDRASVSENGGASLTTTAPQSDELLILEVAAKEAPEEIRVRDVQGKKDIGSTTAIMASGLHVFSPLTRDVIMSTDIDLNADSQGKILDAGGTGDGAEDGTGDGTEAGTEDDAEGSEETEVTAPETVEDICNGESYQNGCWYLGDTGKSCDEVCAARGGYSDLTKTVAGSAGTEDACFEIVGKLQPQFVQGPSTPGCAFGYGCLLSSTLAIRCLNDTLSETAHPAFRRVCACEE